MATDIYAITNPKRALKRREAEADAGPASDGDGGTAAPAKNEGDVRWSKGRPEALTPEERARRIEQFRRLQRNQSKPPARVI